MTITASKRIAFVSQPWHPFAAPVQTPDSMAILTCALAEGLAAAHPVTVFSRGIRSQPRQETHRAVQHRRVPAPLSRVAALIESLERWKGVPGRRPFCSSPLFYRGYIAGINRALQSHPQDIAHVHTFPQFVEAIRRRNPGLRTVLHMHDDSLAAMEHPALARRLAAADLILGCSGFIVARIQQRFPALADRCRVLYNGIQPAGAGPESAAAPPRRRILYVGRWSPEKGLHLLLQSLPAVLEACPDADVEIIGAPWIAHPCFTNPNGSNPRLAGLRAYYRQPGRYLPYCRSLVPPGFRDRIHFTGVRPHASMRQHYRDAAVLVCPSLWAEPFGMPVVEAMAAGRPVVASRTGGLPELVEHEKTGLLVEPGDGPALAGAVQRLLRDERERAALGENARRRAAAFAWPNIVATLEGYYQSL
jgi:glycosyltransferase involved in cell wall biosynthesis